MAGMVHNLLNHDGRWFARLVVPKELRAYVGKTELRTALQHAYREEHDNSILDVLFS